MADIQEIFIPDIGGAVDVEVIEVMVAPGDSIAQDDSLITLESDKASMEIPAPCAGAVKDIQLKVGDKVSEGALILTLEVAGEVSAEAPAAAPAAAPAEEATAEAPTATPAEKAPAVVPASPPVASPQTVEVNIPDIGGATDVDVIEVFVNVGDDVNVDDSLVTLEGEKATMEIPSPHAGQIKAVTIKVGDKVNEGSLILTMDAQAASAATASVAEASVAEAPTSAKPTAAQAAPQVTAAPAGKGGVIYAGPSVRRMARELGVDLTQVPGSGRKGRIQKTDIQQFVKAAMSGGGAAASGGGFNLPQAPAVDFSKFGATEIKPLSKIKKISGANLHRNWVTIPHVTQFDEADITEMEAFRKASKAEAEKAGVRLTPLVFLMKAVVASLKAFPNFNASLDPQGENLILKQYYHVGVAVDTPNGLMVPVIRDVDKKGLFVLSQELMDISSKAREKGLGPADMQGSCFTISSLGGIGGTAFTPIVNAPDVAILGVSRSSMKPVYQDGEFVARLMLPLSLSYDHRVVDGAEAARFIVFLSKQLGDIRRLLL